MDEIVNAVKDFGFPIVAAVGMLYMIYFVWKTITEEIEAKLGDAHVTLIGLIDRIRMLDNDMIRLNTKIQMILQEQEKMHEEERRENRRKNKHISDTRL